MPIKISTSVNVSAAHFVQTSEGHCKNLHGHNWVFEIELTGETLKSDGMLYDFNKIKELIKELDHKVIAPSESYLVIVREINRKYYGIGVKKFIDPMTASHKDFTPIVERKCIKEYQIPIDEVVLIPVHEITAEQLAIHYANIISTETQCKTTIRVWESDTSYAEKTVEG